MKFLLSSSAAFMLWAGAAYAHDPQRPELNGWYESLINENGGDCCDKTHEDDCHPLRFGNKGEPGVQAWIGKDESGERVYQFIADPKIFPHAKGEIISEQMKNRAYQWVDKGHNVKRIAANPYGGSTMVVCAEFRGMDGNYWINLYCFCPPDFEG